MKREVYYIEIRGVIIWYHYQDHVFGILSQKIKFPGYLLISSNWFEIIVVGQGLLTKFQNFDCAQY